MMSYEWGRSSSKKFHQHFNHEVKTAESQTTLKKLIFPLHSKKISTPKQLRRFLQQLVLATRQFIDATTKSSLFSPNSMFYIYPPTPMVLSRSGTKKKRISSCIKGYCSALLCTENDGKISSFWSIYSVPIMFIWTAYLNFDTALQQATQFKQPFYRSWPQSNRTHHQNHIARRHENYHMNFIQILLFERR